MEFLLQRIRGMRMQDGDEGAEVEKPKVLEEVSLEGIVKHIQQMEPNKILVMTGAGISTAAGIPDFRTPGTGLYDNLQKYDLPNPMSIFDISYFPINPTPFYTLAKEMYPGKFKPTLSHYFIRLLQLKGKLLRNYTQNIDTLERRAGLTDEVTVEAHGAFHIAHCITCGAEYDHEYVKEQVFADELPKCTKEGCWKVPEKDGEPYRGLVKPDIVFFGESLPERFGKLAGKDTQECDLLIVMGTSLAVQPFATLASRVRQNCPRLLINLTKVGESDPLMVLLGTGAGFDFTDTSYRDVFLEGTCDDGVRKLANLLGWEDELLKLCEDEHTRLEAEMPPEFKTSNTGAMPIDNTTDVRPTSTTNSTTCTVSTGTTSTTGTTGTTSTTETTSTTGTTETTSTTGTTETTSTTGTTSTGTTTTSTGTTATSTTVTSNMDTLTSSDC